jgi:hypothetical protein
VGAAEAGGGSGLPAVNDGSGAGVNGGAGLEGWTLGTAGAGGALAAAGGGAGGVEITGASAHATPVSRHPAERTATDQRARDAAHIYCYWATVANAMPRNIGVEAEMPSCYGECVRVSRASKFVAVLVAITGAAGGCSRSELSDLGAFSAEENTPSGVPSNGAVTLEPIDAGPDAVVPPPPTSHPPVKPAQKGCAPTDETCNGKDDDCDGQIDQGLPAIPCAGGGAQYCIAGRWSECPVRCDACMPGSERVCFLSYCTYWAVQTCSADGRSFGVCRERHVPPECEDVASAHKESAQLEQCCLDKGYCCRDEYDLDGDGNRQEMLGACDEVSCH